MRDRTKDRLRSVSQPSTRDIAWAAGFHEGDGYCGKNGTSIEVIVSQRDPQMLYVLKDLFGGSVGLRRNQGSFRRADQHIWRVTGPRARGFMLSIYTFLSDRRRDQVRRTLA